LIIPNEPEITEEPTDSELSEEISPEEEIPGEPEIPYVYHEKIPILMYHEVNDLLSNNLYISVADFISHLDYLEEAGITPISMQQLYDHWVNGVPIPEKPIVLTFDDGYLSMYTTVYPLLKERGWSGTFYCITSARWSENFLSAEMMAEMAVNGMEIGSHTTSHSELSTLTGDTLLHELLDSRETLSSITGQDVTALCYPAGKNNSETRSSAEEAGYVCAVTTNYGFASQSQGLFSLKRIRVNTGCGGAWLKSILKSLDY